MKTLNFSTSACRVCRYYRPEGRRGGMCQQLGVLVSANWKACSLAIPTFAPSWDRIDEILKNEKLIVEKALPVQCALGSSQPDIREEKCSSTSETLTASVVLV